MHMNVKRIEEYAPLPVIDDILQQGSQATCKNVFSRKAVVMNMLVV